MHSRLPKAGTAVGLVAGLVASSLIMAPASSAEEPTTPGNNLAFPVLWSEADYQLPLRGVPGEPTIDGQQLACDEESIGTTENGAIQKDEGNTWQADTLVAPGNSVANVDWGDNLEAKDWRVGQVVRVETALYADVSTAPMTGYEMCYISGSGQTEVWGAQVQSGGGGMDTMRDPMVTSRTGKPDVPGKPKNPGEGITDPEGDVTNEPVDESTSDQNGEASSDEQGQSQDGSLTEMVEEPKADALVEFESTEAMVYSAGARLTIQRIDEGADPTWDATQRRWVGTGVADPVFNGAVHERTEEGPGSYGAEINVSGKLVYGYVWRTEGLFNGEYRVTFSLDGAIGDFPGTGTSLAGATIRPSAEEVITAADISALAQGSGSGSGSGGGHGGGTDGEEGGNSAVVLDADNLSFIDVALTGGENPPVVPDPEPTNPPAPPSTDTGGSAPAAPSVPGATSPGGINPGAGQPGAGVPVGIASPIQAQQRVRQRAQITAPKSSKQRVRTRLMLTEEPVFTDQGVTVRWRVTKKSQDNCTIRNRDGEVSVKFTKRGRCTVVAWAPSPNPLVYAPFNEKRIYKVRNTL